MFYFIDIEDNQGVTRDTSGSNYRSYKEACTEALSSLMELVSNSKLDGQVLHAYIRNAEDQIVYKATLSLSGHDFDGVPYPTA